MAYRPLRARIGSSRFSPHRCQTLPGRPSCPRFPAPQGPHPGGQGPPAPGESSRHPGGTCRRCAAGWLLPRQRQWLWRPHRNQCPLPSHRCAAHLSARQWCCAGWWFCRCPVRSSNSAERSFSLSGSAAAGRPVYHWKQKCSVLLPEFSRCPWGCSLHVFIAVYSC